MPHSWASASEFGMQGVTPATFQYIAFDDETGPVIIADYVHDRHPEVTTSDCWCRACPFIVQMIFECLQRWACRSGRARQDVQQVGAQVALGGCRSQDKHRHVPVSLLTMHHLPMITVR